MVGKLLLSTDGACSPLLALGGDAAAVPCCSIPCWPLRWVLLLVAYRPHALRRNGHDDEEAADQQDAREV